MTRILCLAAALGIIACDDESVTYDNDLSFDVAGESFRWRTSAEEGGCLLRNLGQTLSCTVTGGVREGETDFRLTLTDEEVLVDRVAYVDTVQTAQPDVGLEVWIPGDDGPRELASSSSIDEEAQVTLDRIDNGIARGDFSAVIEDRATSEQLTISGHFEMTLTE